MVKERNLEKIQLLAMSRKELDIERVLSDFSIDISFSNTLANEDIRIYVQNRLRNEPRYRHWPKELLAEIQDALVTGAKGM
jgi:hypothetical protein